MFRFANIKLMVVSVETGFQQPDVGPGQLTLVPRARVDIDRHFAHVGWVSTTCLVMAANTLGRILVTSG